MVALNTLSDGQNREQALLLDPNLAEAMAIYGLSSQVIQHHSCYILCSRKSKGHLDIYNFATPRGMWILAPDQGSNPAPCNESMESYRLDR